jgi:nicotinamidase-related amidase
MIQVKPNENLVVAVVDMLERFCNPQDPAALAEARAFYQQMEDQHYSNLPPEHKKYLRAKWEQQIFHAYPLGNADTLSLSHRLPPILSAFRNVGASILHTFVKDKNSQSSRIDFMNKPDAGDLILGKARDSLFDGLKFDKIMRVDTMVFCGVNLSACIRSSAVDAVKAGYNTYVLVDCTTNDRTFKTKKDNDFRALKKAGVVATTAEEFLEDYGRALKGKLYVRNRTFSKHFV